MKGFSLSNCLTGKNKPLKREYGSQKKANVPVMTESSPSEQAPKKGRPSKTVKHLKMQAIPNLKPETITSIVKERREPSVELTVDGSISYIKFVDEHVLSRQTVTAGRHTINAFLSWVYITISNAKRLLLDVLHKLLIGFLQYYLNEFCHKSNRRYFREKLSDRLVFVAISYNTEFKSGIYNRTLCR